MKRESLDTNVLLRLMLADVPAQSEVARKLVESRAVRYFVSDVAIAEFAHVLVRHYKFSRTQVTEVIKGLLSLDAIDCNRELILETLQHFAKYRALSFEDCYLAASAEYMNTPPLWTFDKDLAAKVPSAKLLNT